MDPSKQRRILRRSYFSFSRRRLFSVRSLLICLISFPTLLYLLYHSISFKSSTFRPVLVVSTLSLMSSTSVRTVKSLPRFYSSSPPLKIDGRILFPDHVMVLVKFTSKDDGFECVYYHKSHRLRYGGVDVEKKKALSVDEYDGYRSIVRCPIPPLNCSNFVDLLYKGDIIRANYWWNNGTVTSWDNLVYAATLDVETAVVFVKGLNLRPGRESDPTQYSCHFELERNQSFVLSTATRALSAGQEVVRCSLPHWISDNLRGAQGVRVTVGVRPRVRNQNQANKRILLPSVARIVNPAVYEENSKKYELCVCSMVWNQASAIREWIMYHSWLGVERWFIYDNNSDDGIDKVIKDLDAQNYNVTRHIWPWVKTQEAGFSHCALRAKNECHWVSFMDVDEYFYFPYSNPGHDKLREPGYATEGSLRALVVNLSLSSTAIAEVRTSCHSFGPSGLSSRPSRGVTMGYTCRLQSPERHKSIIRPDALDTTLLNVVHHFRLREGFEYINLPQSTAVINHYKYQVWDIFKAKFYRRVATYVADWQENQNEGSRDRAPGLGTEAVEPPDWPQKFCEVWDTGLRDFVFANMAHSLTGLLPWETDSSLTY